MTNPLVSILVPVYNVAPFIQRCIHSLLGQTYDNLEFVFVDDASPDASMVILQQTLEIYPQRKDQVKIIQHHDNKGIGATRKTLLEAAVGDYLVWVDSDDYLAEDAVQILVNEAQAASVDIVATDSYFSCRGENLIVTVQQHFPAEAYQYIEALAFRQVRAALWGMLSKRDLWLRHQISFAEKVNFGEDYCATVQLFYFAEKMSVLHSPLYFYNQANNSSYSSGAKNDEHFKSMIRLFALLEEFFRSQKSIQKFQPYLDKARLMERSAYLLHTTPLLRRKYAALFIQEAARFPEKQLPLSVWQHFLLRTITSQYFLLADVFILIAKILRLLFKLKF